MMRPVVNAQLDAMLKSVLQQVGFTGRIESTLETRLGRAIDPRLADLGQLLFFDRGGGLHDDNICAGCHSPQPGSANAVDRHRRAEQSGRRSGPDRPAQSAPLAVGGEHCVLPKPDVERALFRAVGDPFDNSRGSSFPRPKARPSFPQTTRSSATCWSPRRTSRRPNSSRSPASPGRRARSARASISSTMATGVLCRRPTVRDSATNRSARTCWRD